MDMRLEVVVLPVSDVDRAKAFYQGAGFREDVDYASDEGFRVVRFTPPGSAASIVFGRGVTVAAPGSTQGLHLVVPDLDAAIAALRDAGIEVTDAFHDIGGVFYHHSPEFERPRPGPSPTRWRLICPVPRPGWQRLDPPGIRDAGALSPFRPFEDSSAIRELALATVSRRVDRPVRSSSCRRNKDIHGDDHQRGRWSGRRDSNPRHPAWEADTLPAELLPLGAPESYRTTNPAVHARSRLGPVERSPARVRSQAG